MGAPPVTAIGTPDAPKLKEGHRAVVVFASKPNVAFWITTVKPPGLDRGAAIDTTTQFNEKWRSKAKRALMEMMESTSTCGYNPAVLDDIMDMLEDDDDDAITVWFPDESAWSFWGYLQKFDPAELSEGTFPTAGLTITPTMEDPATGTEEDPVYTPPAGT